jgi:putative tricarboxylic transport membrane protein
MTARTWDLSIGVTFTVLGLLLLREGWRLPEGVAGIPGPGFLPLLIGAALATLGCALAVSARQARGVYWPRGWRDPFLRQTVAIVVLVAMYVALWDVVPFAVRTPLLLLAIYRVVGEGWWRGALVAGAATAILGLVFTVLLRVRL